MIPSKGFWDWQLLASSIILGGALAFSGSPTKAQIVPDTILGAEISVVTPQAPDSGVDVIQGGATRGANLFHSFEQFSVPTGGAAYFNNALDVQNIISRVTGGSISNIDGLIQANGSANLFLLNPNGIIFGSNASLSIGGSFVGSTASSLNFADGTSFSATAPQNTPLLTVSVPLGLQFGENPGKILVQGNGQGLRSTSELIDTTVGLRVQTNQTLVMVGGDVELSGGTLKTAGGRIELGSVADSGLVSLTSIDKGWSLEYSSAPTFGYIHLSGGAAVDASGEGSGDIQVRGRQVTLKDGSQIEASTLATRSGGSLNVIASESVELIGESANGQFASGLFASTSSGGKAGDLTITTERLTVRDGAVVSAGTFGTGDGGTLSVSASDVVELIGRSANGQSASGLFAQVDPRAEGDAGDLTIATGRLTVRDGAQVSTTTTGSGDGGTLSVSASDVVEVIGRSANGRGRPSALAAQTRGDGNAGDLTITTRQLTIRDGAQVSTATTGSGDGGTLSVSASDIIELIGRSADDLVPSALSTQTQGDGKAGDLTITTERLTVRDGAVVSANTFGTGAGGRLSVSAADVVELTGTSANGQFASGLFASTSSGGKAGDLTITTERLTVRDRAQVTVRSRGSGNAGSLRVQAGSILLENQGNLLASTTSGEGGNIDLQVQDLISIRYNSLISAEASGTGNGGNITINAPFIVAVPAENSDIFANAIQGQGGNIEITTQGIYGLEYRSSLTSESDINASSQFGVSGTVEINNPDVDPIQGLVELPAELVDASNQIATGCSVAGENEFIITGRGGLPPNPRQVLRSNAVQVDWVELDASAENRSSTKPATNSTIDSASTTIVEANGWVINNKGEVVLTTQVSTATPHIPWLTPATCQTPQKTS